MTEKEAADFIRYIVRESFVEGLRAGFDMNGRVLLMEAIEENTDRLKEFFLERAKKGSL